MSIDNPVGGHSKDPYERYRVAREAQEREEHSPEPPNKKPHLAARLLALIKKTLESLLKMTHRGENGEQEIPLQENLFNLKSAFNVLKREDRHQDVPFLNQLSDTWHRLLEQSLRYRRGDPIYAPLQDFLFDIQNYPPSVEHSFAYYLTEYTGQQWLPFPYMDLIQKIHLDHQTNPKESALQRWTTQLDLLLDIDSQ